MLLVAAGNTHKETSSRMGCSERKVERLLASARDRCGAKSTPHLMAVLNLAGFGLPRAEERTEEFMLWMRERDAKSRELVRASSRAWAAANPERKAHNENTRRARKTGNGGSHTVQEWREKCALFANRCAYCGEARPLTRDHEIPLARGGSDDITNIVPACRSCNSRKNIRTAGVFRSILDLADFGRCETTEQGVTIPSEDASR